MTTKSSYSTNSLYKAEARCFVIEQMAHGGQNGRADHPVAITRQEGKVVRSENLELLAVRRHGGRVPGRGKRVPLATRE